MLSPDWQLWAPGAPDCNEITPFLEWDLAPSTSPQCGLAAEGILEDPALLVNARQGGAFFLEKDRMPYSHQHSGANLGAYAATHFPITHKPSSPASQSSGLEIRRWALPLGEVA